MPFSASHSALKESVLRTLVPVVVALLVRWGVQDALGIDDVTLQILASAVVTGVYYVAVRIAERVGSSKWGWLLGYPSAPTYPPKV